MESLIRTLSSGNVNARNGMGGNGSSNANFGNLLQSMQSLNSVGNLLGSGKCFRCFFLHDFTYLLAFFRLQRK